VTNIKAAEWATLAAQFDTAALTDSPDGSALVTIDNVQLPAGWSASATQVHFLVPVGYPAAQPDCFWAAADLRLSSGAIPLNSGIQTIPLAQHPGLWFSWHLASWRPSLDTLSTYARFILKRFSDAR
jgi:hypothetical protein